MILAPGFVFAISSASRAQQLPFSIMTVSPGETSFAASGDQPFFFLIVERQTVVDVIVSAKAGVAMLPPEDTPCFPERPDPCEW